MIPIATCFLARLAGSQRRVQRAFLHITRPAKRDRKAAAGGAKKDAGGVGDYVYFFFQFLSPRRFRCRECLCPRNRLVLVIEGLGHLYARCERHRSFTTPGSFAQVRTSQRRTRQLTVKTRVLDEREIESDREIKECVCERERERESVDGESPVGTNAGKGARWSREPQSTSLGQMIGSRHWQQ